MKVSVQMVTYNHEKFIAKALDSILMQETNFDFEIVIGEDCSTDRTRDIILEYNNRNPEKFVLLLNKENLGMHKNGMQTFMACKGKYLAVLEGDDYWTSPHKLQKMVDFLDNNQEYSYCFHNAMIENQETGEFTPYCPPNQKELSTIENLLEYGNFIPTCGVMYRREVILNSPDWFSSLKMTDLACHIFCATCGKIGYIDEIMGVYVIHPGGVWFNMRHDLEKNAQAQIDFYKKFYYFLDKKYKKIIRRKLNDLYLDVLINYENLNDSGKAKKFVMNNFSRHFVINRESIKTLLRLYFPKLYKYFRSVKRLVCN